MKLYRAKVPAIAHEVIDLLAREEDIEVAPASREEAERDLVAIMEEFLRRDNDLRNQIRDHMATRNIPYDEYGKARKAIVDQADHPTGDEVDKFQARQFIENLLISRWVDEVFSDDKVIFKKILNVLRDNDVDEKAIREEAVGRVKNVVEGTVEYEIALQNAVKEVKKRRGLV